MRFDTEDELRDALASGRLQEGDQLDFKRALEPGDRGSRRLAIDLASFGVSGGTVIVGVTDGRPPELSPVALAGLRERVEQVARSAVDPPLRVRVREIPAANESGYLVIEIPPSPAAPHAVDNVFRSRAGSTNVQLSATEVRQLLATTASERQIRPIEDVLQEFVERDPTPRERRGHAHLFIVARPRGAAPQMLEASVGSRWEDWTRGVLASAPRLTAEWSPDLREAMRVAALPDGWAATTFEWPRRPQDDYREESGLELEFAEDGTARLFCSRGSDHYKGGEVVFELLIGGLVHRTVHAATAVAEATGYAGQWDWGLALTNLVDVVSYFRLNHWWNDRSDLPPYPESEYRRTVVLTAADVSQPDLVVDRLLAPFNRVLNDRRAPMPTLPV